MRKRKSCTLLLMLHNARKSERKGTMVRPLTNDHSMDLSTVGLQMPKAKVWTYQPRLGNPPNGFDEYCILEYWGLNHPSKQQDVTKFLALNKAESDFIGLLEAKIRQLIFIMFLPSIFDSVRSSANHLADGIARIILL